jgi:hypothetical protein
MTAYEVEEIGGRSRRKRLSFAALLKRRETKSKKKFSNDDDLRVSLFKAYSTAAE